MVTLNGIIERLIEYEWKKVLLGEGKVLISHPVETELLLDQCMPDVYPVLELSRNPIMASLYELFYEINYHSKSTKRRVITNSGKESNNIELAWAGNILTKETLREINLNYRVGKQLKEKPDRSGTLRAGYFLGQVGGKVLIENFSDGIYTVRNVIKIPVSDR